jgi:hypothetical protein
MLNMVDILILQGEHDAVSLRLQPSWFPVCSAKQGHPTAFLPLMHYTLLSFSNRISEYIVERGYELYGKSDLRFMEAVYRVGMSDSCWQLTANVSLALVM